MSSGRFVTVVLAFALLVPRASRAEPDAATPPSGGLAYDDVDNSTVRIFAVGTVGLETFDVAGRPITVAEPQSGHGTGFAVGPGGLILTAQHVVDGARHVVVRLPGEGGFFGARVVFSDKDADIALLDVEAELSTLLLADDVALRVRQAVFAIGYPIDPRRTQPQSARGIVAGQLDDGTLQLDMALNPGNSGGPLLDEHDRVVGMVVARGDVEAGVQGIGFAVPAAKLTAAVSEAQRRLAAGQVAELTARGRQGAVVVDELIQQGALHQIRASADLPGGLTSADLDNALDALIGRIDDADLLVFVAGTLWNGALALEFGGVRTIGKTTLTDTDAFELARHLRASATEACRRAAQLDTSVGGRSPFVAHALRPAEEPRWSTAAPTTVTAQSWFEPSVRITPHLRVNPTGRGSWGMGFAGNLTKRPAAGERKGARVAPLLGAAFGFVSFDGPMAGETIFHGYFAVELGMVARIGAGSRHLSLVAAYTPGFYESVVENEHGTSIAEASAVTYMHFRVAAGIRTGWLQIGSGVRMLSGPTWWIEPLFFEGAF